MPTPLILTPQIPTPWIPTPWISTLPLYLPPLVYLSSPRVMLDQRCPPPRRDLIAWLQYMNQWWIQDFPYVVAPTAEFGTKRYYLTRFLPKTASKMKIIWPRLGRGRPTYLTPPPTPRYCQCVNDRSNHCLLFPNNYF